MVGDVFKSSLTVTADAFKSAADTVVIRPETTFDKTSIRCRSRSLIAINPICNLPHVIQTRGV
jgi:hypothetical protein